MDVSFENLKRAVVYGSVLASFCVEKFGTEQLKKITQKKIDCRINTFVEMAGFNLLKN